MQSDPISNLIDALNTLLEPMGYEIVHAEAETHRQKLLRLFIDFTSSVGKNAVGIEDCVRVTRAVDEPMDQDPSLVPLVEAIFHGASYELEVSSPGVDRPLRQLKDFERFAGRDARIHVFRPLSADELGNAQYHLRNPKQKNFVGTLQGVNGEKVLLMVPRSGSVGEKKTGRKKGNGRPPNDLTAAPKSDEAADEVSIPLPLISKAHLEAQFEIGDAEET